jgi:hypothetical protein
MSSSKSILEKWRDFLQQVDMIFCPCCACKKFKFRLGLALAFHFPIRDV